MTKLLNLDDIAIDSKRTVIFGGEEHKVVDFDIESFIKFQGHFKAFSDAYNSTNLEDMRKVVDETVAMVKIGVPTFPHEQIKRLNPLQMMALVSMIANLIPDADAETQEGMEKKEQPEGQAE